MSEQASAADVKSKSRRGRPRKTGPVETPPLAGPVELKPGEVEQGNCVNAIAHYRIRTAGTNCAQCGYPGPWVGLSRPQVMHVVAERMDAKRALPFAIDHLRAMIELTAGRNANDLPTDEFCQICDQSTDHPGSSPCVCPCHPARDFLRAMTGAFL